MAQGDGHAEILGIRPIPPRTQAIVDALLRLAREPPEGQSGKPRDKPEGTLKEIEVAMKAADGTQAQAKNLGASIRIRLQEWSSDSKAWTADRPWKQRLDLFYREKSGVWGLRYPDAHYPRSRPPLSNSDIQADDADENEYRRNDEDTRESILRKIRERRGQKAFRNALITAYSGQCAVSGCSVLEILEAAHIDPYRGDNTNHPTNGILLRSDLHMLFDCYLIAIHPNNLTVHLHDSIMESEYIAFGGKHIISSNPKPNPDALEAHYRLSNIAGLP
jgi:hypothetical protein